MHSAVTRSSVRAARKYAAIVDYIYLVLGKGWALNVAKGQHTSRGACRRKNDNQVVGKIKHNDDRLSILACVHTVSTVVYSYCTKKQLKCRQKR